jgi:hypothetical protein
MNGFWHSRSICSIRWYYTSFIPYFTDTSDLRFRLHCDKDHHQKSKSKGYGSYDASKEDCGSDPSTLELLMFRVPDKGKRWVDYWGDGNFCCSAKMMEQDK